MSISLQKSLNERRYGIVKTYGSDKFVREVYADKFFISRLELERELQGHEGCVNSLDWSSDGDKLLSGSDDTKLNIYAAYEDYKLIKTINTGHTANIFTAKFLPKTSNNIIVSGAGDSEVRIFDLEHSADSARPLEIMYVCHGDQVKRICTFENNPYEFLTCSEDGTIRLFDRRQHHVCSAHNVRSFLSPISKPARQWPRPQDTTIVGCPKPLIDCTKDDMTFNSVSVNRLHPHYIAVAGFSEYIYLYDSRMVTKSMDMANSSSKLPSKCVQRFSPPINERIRSTRCITACKFSESNGQELIGSWSSDGIYLFNIKDSVFEKKNMSAAGVRSNSRMKRSNCPSPADLSDEKSDEEGEDSKKAVRRRASWEATHALFRDGKYEPALIGMINVGQQVNQSASKFDRLIGDASVAFMTAAIVNHRRLERDNWYTRNDARMEEDPENDGEDEWSRYFFDHELNKVNEKLLYAEELLAPSAPLPEEEFSNTWHFYWCLAAGFWISRGGYHSIADCDRIAYLQKSLRYIAKAKMCFIKSFGAELQQQQQREQDEPIVNTLNHGEYSYTFYKMITTFLKIVKTTLNRERRTITQVYSPENTFNYAIVDLELTEVVEEEEDYDTKQMDALRRHCHWEQLMYITLYDSQDIEAFLPSLNLLEGNAEQENADTTASASASASDTGQNTSRSAISNAAAFYEEIERLSTTLPEVREMYEAGLLPMHETGTDNDDRDSDDDDVSGDDDEEEEDEDLGYLDAYDWQLIRSQASPRADAQADVNTVQPRKRYTGHCNVETVKDVDFFGLNDEYIVSGSDCGHLFIYDKKTAKIVQILKADADVVNVARAMAYIDIYQQGHPTLPILAVSGIDYTTKIFTPTAKPFSTSKIEQPNNPTSYSSSSRMHAQNEITEGNEEHHNQRHPIYLIRSISLGSFLSPSFMNVTALDSSSDEDTVSNSRNAEEDDDEEDEEDEEEVEEDTPY